MESRRFLFNAPAHGSMLYLGEGEPGLRGTRTMISMQDNPMGRPFFRSHDDLFDEEYYDELYPEKKRRLSHDQVQMLEKSFEEENKLEPERKTQLAKKLGLQPRQVAVWFQNRRARWKTKQLETDYDLLKAAYDSLLSNYDSVLKENQMLKSNVASLTEKFQAKELDKGAPNQDTTSKPLLVAITNVSDPNSTMKAEDHLSSGSDTSAVLDEDRLQLIDSGDSYLPSNEYLLCLPPTTGLQLEDVINDNGHNFLSDVFAATHEQYHEGEPLTWWGWP